MRVAVITGGMGGQHENARGRLPGCGHPFAHQHESQGMALRAQGQRSRIQRLPGRRCGLRFLQRVRRTDCQRGRTRRHASKAPPVHTPVPAMSRPSSVMGCRSHERTHQQARALRLSCRRRCRRTTASPLAWARASSHAPARSTKSQLACDGRGDVAHPAVGGVEGHHAQGIQHLIHGAVPAVGKRQHCGAVGYGTHARLRALGLAHLIGARSVVPRSPLSYGSSAITRSRFESTSRPSATIPLPRMASHGL
jgi:hypothetical protein